jgi:hypothetical protein
MILFLQQIINLLAQDLDAISFKKGIKLNGCLNYSNILFMTNDTLSLREPYAYYLNGNLQLNVCGLDLPFNFAISNTSKTYTQPFNRFQLIPKYKWIKLYLGSSSMNFSEFTLSGHQFNGIGVELSPQNWNISAMYGTLQKAVEYDSVSDNLSTVCYKRKAAAVKVAFSKGTDIVSLDFFTAKDDVNSLLYPVPFAAGLHPMTNTAVNFSAKKTFFKKLYLEGGYAISFLNGEIRNIESDSTKRSASNFIDKLMTLSSSDRYYDAVTSSLGFQDENWGIAFNYKRVSPDYTTLGAYYCTNDIENYTIAPNLKFFKGKFTLSGNIGLEYNNLNGDLASQTRRFVGSGNLAFSSGKNWNGTFDYSNFTTYTKIKPSGYPYYSDNLDTLNFYQVNSSYTSTVSFSSGNDRVKSIWMCMASYQNADGSGGTTVSDFMNAQMSYTLQLPKKETNIGLAFTGNYGGLAGVKILLWGPRLMLGKVLLNKQLNTSLACSYNQNRLNQNVTGSLVNTAFSAVYNLKTKNQKFGKHSISLNANLTNTLQTDENAKSTYQLLGTVAYNWTF